MDPLDDSVQWLRGDLYADMPDLSNSAIATIYSVGPLDGLAQWLSSAKLPSLRQMVALSSMSVEVKARSNDSAEMSLASRLRHAEEGVIAFCQAHAVRCVILRPTLIYGAGIDRSVSALKRFGRRWRVFPWIPGATGLRQPVHAEDLAAACIEAATIDASPPKTLAIGGGEQLSFAEMLARVRASLPVHTIPIPIPLALARTALRVLRLHPRWQYLHEGLIDRMQLDQIVGNEPANDAFAWQPRNFEP